MAQHTVTILPDAAPGIINPLNTQMNNQQNFLTDNTSSYASSKTTPLLVRYWCAAWTKTQVQRYIPLSATVDKIVIKAVASLDGSGNGAVEQQGYIYNGNNTEYDAYSRYSSSFSISGSSWRTGTLQTLTNVPSSFLTQGLMIYGNMVHRNALSRTMRLATVKAEVTYTVPEYYLDLNGYLDGSTSGNISGYGTADIYINNSRVAAGVTDFYTAYEAGSTYQIKNIVPTAGHNYNGVYSGSLTGTLNSNTSVYLNFTTVSTTVTVSFDSQGGTVFPSRELTIGGTYGTLPTPTKSFNEFLGWYTSTSYTTKIESSSIVPSNNHILYAKWQPVGVNNIRLGATAPTQIYIGSQQVKQVYIGSTLVYSIST